MQGAFFVGTERLFDFQVQPDIPVFFLDSQKFVARLSGESGKIIFGSRIGTDDFQDLARFHVADRFFGLK